MVVCWGGLEDESAELEADVRDLGFVEVVGGEDRGQVVGSVEDDLDGLRDTEGACGRVEVRTRSMLECWESARLDQIDERAAESGVLTCGGVIGFVKAPGDAR